MLSANRRVLRRGGSLAFFTIEITEGLDRSRRRRAAIAGPFAVATRSTYLSMLRSAGLSDVECIDLTDEYRATAAAFLAEREQRADEFIGAFGEQVWNERVANGRRAVRAIDNGLLGRTLYFARRP